MPSAGSNKITITYDIDANGILKVSAFDEALHKEANITITSSSGLSKEEIERAKADAEAHAAEDEKKLQIVNKKYSVESLCNSIERTFKDAGDKLTADDKKSVEDKIAIIREVLKTNDIAKIDAAVDEMNKAYEPLVKKLYPDGNSTAGSQQFSKEQFEQMMKDPKFAQMFNGTSTFTGNTSSQNSKSSNNDGSVDAEFC